METLPDTSLSQQELAEKAGVSSTMISHIKAGRKKPSLKVYFAMLGDHVLLNGKWPLAAWRECVRDTRIEQGMSQRELAEKVGYKGHLSIIKLESGKTKTITVDKFHKLIKTLNIKGIEDEHSTIQMQDGSNDGHEQYSGGTGEPASTGQPVSGASVQD